MVVGRERGGWAVGVTEVGAGRVWLSWGQSSSFQGLFKMGRPAGVHVGRSHIEETPHLPKCGITVQQLLQHAGVQTYAISNAKQMHQFQHQMPLSLWACRH